MTAEHPDAVLYRKLRAETIGLLGLDPAALTTAQGVKVDLVSSLRLSIDTFQAQQLRGEQVDVGKLLSASEALARLLPKALTIDADAHKVHLESARAKFTALIERYSTELDRSQDVEIAALKAALAEKDQVIAEKNSVIAALTAGAAPSPPTPPASPAPAPSQQRSNQPPLGPPNTPIPRHYLRDGQPPSPLVGDGRVYDRWRNNNV